MVGLAGGWCIYHPQIYLAPLSGVAVGTPAGQVQFLKAEAKDLWQLKADGYRMDGWNRNRSPSVAGKKTWLNSSECI